MTSKFVPFPGARYVLKTGQVKASTPVQSETLPEGVVLTLCAAVKRKSYPVDETITLRYTEEISARRLMCSPPSGRKMSRGGCVLNQHPEIEAPVYAGTGVDCFRKAPRNIFSPIFPCSLLSFPPPVFFLTVWWSTGGCNFVAYRESTTVQLARVFFS